MKKKSIFQTLLARLDGFDASRVRRSLSVYGDPDAPLSKSPNMLVGIAYFVLRSACLTLELFLHSKFGKRYLTVPKAIFGLLLPVFCVYLGMFDFQIVAKLDPASPGLVKFLGPNAERIADAVDNEAKSVRQKLADAKQAKIDALRAKLQEVETKLDAKMADIKMKILRAASDNDKFGLLNEQHIIEMERAAHRNVVLNMTTGLENELTEMAEIQINSTLLVNFLDISTARA